MRRILVAILRIAVAAAIVLLLLSPKTIPHLPASWTRILDAGKTAEVAKENETVELSGPTAKSFRWEYRGKEYSISLDLYESLYQHYRQQSRSYRYQGALPADWKEQYVGMFLSPAGNDDSIARLAEALSAAAKKNGLNDDQLAELALAFVQSIPYDESGAAALAASGYSESGVDYLPRYPYETLYLDKGICSDKSFLAYALMKKLGFGAAIFEYDDQHHMAIGIRCPEAYSTYSSGYCYAETTTENNLIGIVPDLDSSSNKPLGDKEISYYGAGGSASGTELSQPEILARVSGKAYGGIKATVDAQNRLAALKKELRALDQKILAAKKGLDSDKDELDDVADRMNDYKKDGKYEKYNALVDDYNAKAKDYKKAVSAYNDQVGSYNAKVKEYNRLAKTLYP